MATAVRAVHDIGVASQIGKYSDAVEVKQPERMLFISGTPGLMPDGKVSTNFEQQAEQAWRNVLKILQQAGMGPENLTKIVQYLVRPGDLATYGAIRARMLAVARPTSMLMVVVALPRADFLIEIEAYAAA